MDAIKSFLFGFFLLVCFGLSAQTNDSLTQFKKKILESVEVDLLMSYYEQEGIHAAVSGGIGNEHLTNYAPTIVVRMPISEDAYLTADVGISAYTSASSSNGNPFNQSGASTRGGEEVRGSYNAPKGSPWVASSGASGKDVLTTVNLAYQNASDDRNRYWGVNVGGSNEYDYSSFNFGASFAQLWNEKNTEFSLKAQVFLDQWDPIIPTELHEYALFQDTFLYNQDSYFLGVSITDDQGNSVAGYLPENFTSYTTVSRNSFAVSLGLSQILSPKLQGAIFTDLVFQKGLLSNPLQRVYFQDRDNFYIGNFRTIAQYTNPDNKDVFHLADDVERLPSQRLKIPLGARLNYYINEYFVLRSYARYYTDDWGIHSSTFQVELPIRFNLSWKLTPIYRYYSQTAADYFGEYNSHLSSQKFYTSDYDLSDFSSHQWGVSLNYRSVLSQLKLFDFGLKSAQLRAQHYSRSDGLSAYIVSTSFRFVLDQ